MSDPIAWIRSRINWKDRQSEATIKLTRHEQPEYGFVVPLYDAAEIERLRAELAAKDAAIAQAYEDGRISACNAGKPGCPRVAALEAECAPFLKDGETPAECIARWRAEAVAILELLRQERVRSEKAEAELAARDWQPIETAPKDGTWFLAICAGVDKRTGKSWWPAIISINADGNYVPDDIADEFDVEFSPDEWELTHWMPLPKEPKS